MTDAAVNAPTPRGAGLPGPVLALSYAVLGYAVVWAPWRIASAAGWTSAANPIEGFQTVSYVLLFLVGVAGALTAPRRSPALAILTVAVFPLLSILEMARDPASHNLWPIEFVFYGLLSLCAVVGVGVTVWLRERLSRRSRRPTAP
jgi:hypothetical protein